MPQLGPHLRFEIEPTPPVLVCAAKVTKDSSHLYTSFCVASNLLWGRSLDLPLEPVYVRTHWMRHMALFAGIQRTSGYVSHGRNFRRTTGDGRKVSYRSPHIDAIIVRELRRRYKRCYGDATVSSNLS